MSGIIGIVQDGTPIDVPLLESLTQDLAWRGPDAQRCWFGAGVGFGHALLRTTWEAKRETQPFSLQGHFHITADARIDARGELIDKLRSKFGTVSNEAPDPELILLAYSAWGDDCMAHLIGDFAFGIWDSEKKRLFCARDHFGVTPFYYCQLGNSLVFSNTLRCLRSYPGVSSTLNELAIADYLLTGCNQESDTTWFRDIRTLPPAHTLSLSGASLQLKRYWSAPPSDSATLLKYSRPEEYAEHFGAIFQQAVTDRLRVDEVASSMSGGLDSTAITAVAHRAYRQGLSNTKVTAYSIGFDWLMSEDERVYAALVAERNDIPTHYLSAEKYLVVDELDKAWKKMPEPRFSARPVPAWEINESAAKNGVRVSLGGLGGDPLLMLNQGHWDELIAHRRFVTLAKEAKVFQATYGIRPQLGLKSRLKGTYGKPPANSGLPYPSFQRFNGDFAGRVNLLERIQFLNEKLSKEPAREGMASLSFWANALSSSDPDVTSLPVKVRHPFFDVRLMEYVAKVPPIPWLLNKNLLRAAMEGVLPEKVRCRAKTPLRSNFYYELATRGYEPWIPELLSVLELEQYVNVSYVRSLLETRDESLRNKCEKMLYYPLSLGLWLKEQG